MKISSSQSRKCEYMGRMTIDEKIEQQKQVIFKLKDKYDAAVEELTRLMQKHDEQKERRCKL